MSIPKFTEGATPLTRDDAINKVIVSIAMEEAGLSHIINAEGEKLQYALGTIEGVQGPDTPPTIAELLDINNSVQKTLDSSMMNQFMLKEKLNTALSASTMRGPAGPVGTILDSYDTYDEFIAAHPTGEEGNTYLVAGEMYVWDVETGTWKSVGNLIGPQGEQGPAGPVGTILDSYDTYDEFVAAHPTGVTGDTYLVAGVMYIWDDDNTAWKPVGNLIGPQGEQGEQGVPGPVGTILGYFDTLDELRAAHSPGSRGDAYIVGDGNLYTWRENSTDWEYCGNLRGPQGAQGEQGEAGVRGPEGPVGPQGIQGPSGTGGTIQGTYSTLAELEAAYPTGGNPGDMFAVGSIPFSYHVYIWDTAATPPQWTDLGVFSTAVGQQGEQGQPGAASVILGSYDTVAELEQAHPTGAAGECYIVGGDLYTWLDNGGAPGWVNVGHIQGPEGTVAPGTELFNVQSNGTAFSVEYSETLKLLSQSLTITANPAEKSVSIESIPSEKPDLLHFNGLGMMRLNSGASGGRGYFAAIGNGGIVLTGITSDPVTITKPGISIKITRDAVIKQVDVFAVLDAANFDIVTTVYAQLYYADGYTAKEFRPVPNSLIEVGVFPVAAAEGYTLTGKTPDDFSFDCPAGYQLIIGFYNTSETFTSGRDTLLSGTVQIDYNV